MQKQSRIYVTSSEQEDTNQEESQDHVKEKHP